MKKTFKIFAIATFGGASAASAFAANRLDRGEGQWQQFENYNYNHNASDRESLVRATG